VVWSSDNRAEGCIVISRRRFFTGLLAAAASGTLLSSTDLLAATLTGDKYSETIRLARRVIDLTPLVDRRDTSLSSQRMGVLIRHMMDNFAPTCTTEDIRPIFARTKRFDALNEDDLRRLVEGVVPVAVMREMVLTHRVPFEPNRTDGWATFVGRYQHVILDC
jgi:hypothetical protein